MEFFQVIVIVCAIVLSPSTSQTDDTCFYIEDTLGAKQSGYSGLYGTLEECNVRRELILSVLDDILLTSSDQRTVSSNCPKVVIE